MLDGCLSRQRLFLSKVQFHRRLKPEVRGNFFGSPLSNWRQRRCDFSMTTVKSDSSQETEYCGTFAVSLYMDRADSHQALIRIVTRMLMAFALVIAFWL